MYCQENIKIFHRFLDKEKSLYIRYLRIYSDFIFGCEGRVKADWKSVLWTVFPLERANYALPRRNGWTVGSNPSQIFYTKKEACKLGFFCFLVARVGFEPTTFGLWARRASELLYLAMQCYYTIIYCNLSRVIQKNSKFPYFTLEILLSSIFLCGFWVFSI